MRKACVFCKNFKTSSNEEMLLQNIFARCILGIWKNDLDSDMDNFAEQLKTADQCKDYDDVKN